MVMNATLGKLKKSTSLTAELVRILGDRVRDGTWAAGQKLPKEADLIDEFGVSRTVVREAMSRLQAAGVLETRHGVGTFVVGMGDGAIFRVSPDQMATLHDVIAVLELRIAVESEGAGLAASRRTSAQLQAIRSALDAFIAALESGRPTIGPDFQFHLEVSRATQNARFASLVEALGGSMIPRSRLDEEVVLSEAQKTYLRGVNQEHETIYQAIQRQDADAARAAMRTHLTNSRERRKQALS
jgi:GntR family transcriptional repressor for pyruvate dehydrogenase complex